jgi:hypothetical protein
MHHPLDAARKLREAGDGSEREKDKQAGAKEREANKVSHERAPFLENVCSAAEHIYCSTLIPVKNFLGYLFAFFCGGFRKLL